MMSEVTLYKIVILIKEAIMPKRIFNISNSTGVVCRDKREELDKIFVEVDPNPRKSRKHAPIIVHEIGLGLRGKVVIAKTPVVIAEDPAQLTFVSILGK